MPTSLRQMRQRRLGNSKWVAIALIAAAATATNGAEPSWSPFAKTTYTTSSFAENRGSRYHAGIDLGTEMEQGWPIVAPEEGWVERVRISPFFYGKNLFYRTKSGKLWLLAHLSGFPEPLSSMVDGELRKNRAFQGDLRRLKIPFRTGDTLAFAGKTGIGNPHLHIERRDKTGAILFPPIALGVQQLDTIPPELLELALFDSDGTVELFPLTTSGTKTVELPIRPEMRLAAKLVDYSRAPKKNPMSIAELTLRCSDGTVLFHKSYQQLRYGEMDHIFGDLLWSREGEVAGDWHWMGRWQQGPKGIQSGDGELSRCCDAAGSGEAQLLVRDGAGLPSLYRLLLRKGEQGEEAPTVVAARADNQDPELFTFLGRPFLRSDVAAVLQHRPIPPSGVEKALPLAALSLKGDSISWKSGGKRVRQVELLKSSPAGDSLLYQSEQGEWRLKVAPSEWEQWITAEWRSDSTGPFLELHPKGLQLATKTEMEVCLVAPTEKGWGLFWRSESAREWNAFSRSYWRDSSQIDTAAKTPTAPTSDTLPPPQLCTTVDEIRDLAVRRDTLPPLLDSVVIDTLHLDGKKLPSLSIRVREVGGAGFGSGRNFTATSGKRWLYNEYDLTDERLRIPYREWQNDSTITVEVHDDFGNRTAQTIQLAPYRQTIERKKP